mmetsp:Transcript_37742/g.85675  ORF Transcript_37742/g.85675 Transcript_37742/m.85675 type:complete len:93 (+) Transcript_37742:284-562(+)
MRDGKMKVTTTDVAPDRQSAVGTIPPSTVPSSILTLTQAHSAMQDITYHNGITYQWRHAPIASRDGIRLTPTRGISLSQLPPPHPARHVPTS